MQSCIASSMVPTRQGHNYVIKSGCHRVATGAFVAKRRPSQVEPTWTPNQVVAANLARLRQRRGLTQAETARQLSAIAGKQWTEAMVAHAERSVTGNRVREFTADDLVTFARAFDVPVLYFLTPPPSGVFVQVPNSQISTLTMLEAVLGRFDNLSEWEALLDEWNFADDDELPFPLDQQRRYELRASPERWRWSGRSTSSAATSKVTSWNSGTRSGPSQIWSWTSSSTRPSPRWTKTITSGVSKRCAAKSKKDEELRRQARN